MADQEAPEFSYQGTLRALGAYLDQDVPGRFRVLEFPDGFMLLTENEANGEWLEETHFAYHVLNGQAQQLARGRKLLGSKYRTGWSLSKTGHQDFLRALGLELDESGARQILLDELEDGVLLTYSYLDPTHGFEWRKQLLMLRTDQIASIIDAAHGRRQRRSLRRR